jgi:hemerythrin superfamily protein
MATKSTSARKSTAKRPIAKRRAANRDVFALLKADHEKVQGLFGRYQKTRSGDMKGKLAQQICSELSVHAQLEEEIFYPAVKAAIKQKDLVDKAAVEHKSAKDLIAEIQGSQPGEELYDAKVNVLGEYVKHHIKEEQSQIFPAARKAGVDANGLGAQLAERKKALASGAEPQSGNESTLRPPGYPFPT